MMTDAPSLRCIPLADDLVMWVDDASTGPVNQQAADVAAVLTGEHLQVRGEVQFTGPNGTDLPEVWATFIGMHRDRGARA